MRNTLSLLAILLFLTACKQEQPNVIASNIDSFAFGYSYGECLGNCVETYLIQAEKLYLSNDNQYGSCPSFESYVLLADSSFQKMKTIKNYIPDALWNEPEGSIGMPDAYDQGGYQVQLTIDGQSKCWFIDTDDDNIPAYLYHFTRKIHTSLNELGEE